MRPQLIVTSPPYDHLRTYGGHGFDFDRMADALVSVMPAGGVLVWVVADATIDGSETGNSFRQALGWMERGLRLHDTMIFSSSRQGALTPNRYFQNWEYMFVLSQGRPETANMLIDRRTTMGGLRNRNRGGTGRDKNGSRHKGESTNVRVPAHAKRTAIWHYAVGHNHEQYDNIKHPATFPYALAADHIRTWSNPGDLVLDPMAGSGTVLRAAKDLGRRYVGVEIHEPYCALIRDRLAQSVMPIA